MTKGISCLVLVATKIDCSVPESGISEVIHVLKQGLVFINLFSLHLVHYSHRSECIRVEAGRSAQFFEANIDQLHEAKCSGTFGT